MFEIKNRFTGAVVFSCELSGDMTGWSFGMRLGFAVRKAAAAGADLSGAVLSGAVLRGADLSGADLSGAVLRDAVLRGADLSGADLRGAVLRGADLRDAVLSGADLSDADLSDADLRDADLSGAVLRDAVLRGADLDFFRQDMIAEILRLPAEMDALRAAIVAGKIDGSSYSGECSCLAGTLAKAHGIDAYNGAEIETSAGIFRARPSSPREQWFAMISPGDTPDTNQASRLALQWLDEAIAIRDNIRKGE